MPVLEMLRDPFWQFVVLALLALAAVVVPIVGINRPRKRSSYRVLFDDRLLSVRDELTSRVQVTFDGQPVRDVRMVIAHLMNTGNVPIEASDYIQPLGLSFGEATVLDAEVMDTRPNNMRVSLETNAGRVILTPDVFNGGDAISVRVLLAGPGEVGIDGRIKGLDRIRDVGDRDVSIGVMVMVVLALVIPTAVLTLETLLFKVSEAIFWLSVGVTLLYMVIVQLLWIRRIERRIHL